jgi:hypothetical protein
MQSQFNSALQNESIDRSSKQKKFVDLKKVALSTLIIKILFF